MVVRNIKVAPVPCLAGMGGHVLRCFAAGNLFLRMDASFAMRRTGIAVLLLLVSLSSVAALVPGKRDPETGRIRLLYIGDATNTRNPVYIYKSDPTFEPTLIPACRDVLLSAGLSLDDIRRYMRQYMPKTYHQLKSSFDSIILSDVCVLNFRPEEIEWIERCVKEEGFGLAMVGGFESFGGHNYPGWGGTPVADALPVEFEPDKTAKSGSYKLVVVKPDDELMKPLPWKTAPPFSGLNIVSPKDGSELLANAVGMTNTYPLMVQWRYGEGRVLAFSPDWTPGWGADFCQWAYYLDFASDMAMYISRVPVPQDLALVHSNRQLFYSLQNRRALLASLFEFVDKFGARTSKLEAEVAGAQDLVHRAGEAYVRQEYSDSLNLLDQAKHRYDQIEADALKLKDRAMIWVYIVEWFAVLGTSLITGVILWAVMIRRRLYREVETTRYVA